MDPVGELNGIYRLDCRPRSIVYRFLPVANPVSVSQSVVQWIRSVSVFTGRKVGPGPESMARSATIAGPESMARSARLQVVIFKSLQCSQGPF